MVPELPEVETIARGLANAVGGKTIASVTVSMPKIAVAPPGEDFARRSPGETIAAVGRRGKYVVVQLGLRAAAGGPSAHDRPADRPAGRATRNPIPTPTSRSAFSDGSRLSFADVRQFGRMRLLAAGDPWDADGGVEPLSEGFTSDAFLSMLDGRRTPIKSFLLDQSRIAGIGNIYACEALWEAGIRPSRPSHKISRPARRRLHGAIRNVLQRAIEARGTSAWTITSMPRG